MRSASGPPARAISSSTRPKPACVDIWPFDLDLGERLDGHARRLQPPPALARRTARAPGSARPRPRGSSRPANRSHSSPWLMPSRGAQLVHLRLGHQAGVVVLVALERQPVALDGVGDEAHRLVRRRVVERLQDRLAGRGRRDWSSAAPSAASSCRRTMASVSGWIGEVLLELPPPGGAALEHQRRVEHVGAVVDPLLAGARRRARRRPRCSSLPYLSSTTFQPRFSNSAGHLHEQPVRDHRVEALAVVVDDPPAVPEAVLPVFEQGLVDVALVELGIAHQRDHAALGPVAAPALGVHVVLHEAGKAGRRRRRGPTEPVEKSTSSLSLVREG